MAQTAEELYLDLLKRALSFSMWPEPPVPIEASNYTRSPFKRAIVEVVSKILRSRHLLLAKEVIVNDSDRQNGGVWPWYADTMIGHRRLENLKQCIETVLKERTPGDFIETGVWRGGACIFMRGILAAHDVQDRKVFVADSFEGLPTPNPDEYPADKGDVHHIHPILAVSLEQVRTNFERYGLLDDRVVFLKGWFKDTLPTAPIERLAILRLDGDMYESTIDALKNLYDKLTIGGFCIIDDYSLRGCRKAIDDFRKDNGITEVVVSIDNSSAYWRKQRV